jgi:hypothetical protein
MATRGRRGILVASAAGFVGIALPRAAVAQRCGRVSVPARGIAKVRVVRGPLYCRAARRQIAAAYRAEDTRHWSGYQNPDGVFWRVDGCRCFIGLAGCDTTGRSG